MKRSTIREQKEFIGVGLFLILTTIGILSGGKESALAFFAGWASLMAGTMGD